MLATKIAATYFSQIVRKGAAYSTLAINSEANMSFQEEKTKFLNMPLAEKRGLYNKSVTLLDDVETWNDYWTKHREDLQKLRPNNAEVANETVANRISLWKGDITLLEVDVIVNAANRSLGGGGGVDGAIHRAAGPNLKEECKTLRPCEVGEAKITGGYLLPAKYVIHTVGPQGEMPYKLRSCYQNSLSLAKANKARTIAFPCISTGVYGYPAEAAAHVAMRTVKDFVASYVDDIDRVIFCVFLPTDEEIYKRLLIKYFYLK